MIGGFDAVESLRAVRRFLAFVLVASAIVCAISITGAYSRDDGRYAQSAQKEWFKTLRSQGGSLCCDGADGKRVDDVDWEARDGRYRVRLDGQWIDVPDAAVVTVPNRFGPAVVWPYKADGVTRIRCFLAGAGA